MSRKQTSKVTKEDKSLLALKQQRDKLMQSRDRLNEGIEKDEHDAQVYDQKGKSNQAMTKLRSKEGKEKTFQRIDDNLSDVEDQIHYLELHQVHEYVQTLVKPFVGQQQKKKKKRFKKRKNPNKDAKEKKSKGLKSTETQPYEERNSI